MESVDMLTPEEVLKRAGHRFPADIVAALEAGGYVLLKEQEYWDLAYLAFGPAGESAAPEAPVVE
jgi:hypothetical protein